MSELETMTPAKIEERLRELEALEAEHNARDFEAELADLMRQGGDLDALETAQLEAERVARRLRVERKALEVELPRARAREGAGQVAAFEAEFQELRAQCPDLEKRLAAAWSEYLAAVQAWGAQQRRAAVITFEASRIADASGARMPPMGTFRSAVVEGHHEDLHRNDLAIHESLHQPTVICAHGLQSCDLSTDAAEAEAA